MSKTWRTRLQLAGGVLLILLAAWIVITGGGGDSSPGGSTTSAATSATSQTEAGEPPSGTTESGSTPDSVLETIAESQLPPEGRETLELIRSDGPFPYDRDGITFGNREGILPDLSLIHISEPTRPCGTSRMPSSA